MAASPVRTNAEPEEVDARETAMESLLDWSYIAGAILSMAGTLWLAAAVWATA